MACVIYIAIVLPFHMCFNMPDKKSDVVIDRIITFTFLADVILTFFTSFHDIKSGKEVVSLRRIALNYLTGWFVLDVLSIFPFEALLNESRKNVAGGMSAIRIGRISKLNRLIRFIRLARITRAFKLQQNMKMRATLRIEETQNRMLLFVGTFALMVHLLTCGWCGFKLWDGEHNWMNLKLAALADSGEVINED